MAKFNPNRGDVTYLFGGGFDESIIKLTIFHEDLDPKLISVALGKKPTLAYRKGDLSDNKKLIMNHGMWQLATPWVSKVDFEENLKRFMKKLPRDQKVWRQLTSRYDCSLTAVLRMRTWNRGAAIHPSLIADIASRGLKFEIDVYFDDDAKLWSDKRA